MGQWTIVIHGTGAHHNRAEYDADWIAREAVEKLRKAGHSISGATFTAGTRDDMGGTKHETWPSTVQQGGPSGG